MLPKANKYLSIVLYKAPDGEIKSQKTSDIILYLVKKVLHVMSMCGWMT